MIAAFTSGPRGPVLLASASAAILATALASQYWGGLVPCALCLYQRVPYWVAIGAGIAGAALAAVGWRGAAAAAVAACAAAFAVGLGIAAYHVGVEQGWWAGTAACSGVPSGAAANPAELLRMLETAPMVRCDEVAWSLFGVSMAGYSALASLALLAFAAGSARALWRAPA